MATNTENLGLIKEAPTEFYDIETVNANLDKIDEFAGRKDNPHNVTKFQVGLDKVDNTSDEDKPVSKAQAEAISVAKANVQTNLSGHTNNKSNPHTVTKEQVGLGNVDNTSDMNKPVSTAQQNALNNKVDKVSGKGLSVNDYTTAEKTKLAGIETGANKYVLPSASSTLGGVKTGGDVTISGGVITVNDNSHAHTMGNITGLSEALSGLETEYGSYIGAGVASTEAKTIINTSRTPKAVVISSADVNYPPNAIFVYGQKFMKYDYIYLGAVSLECEWNETSFSIKTNQPQHPGTRFDNLNSVYHYVVIY